MLLRITYLKALICNLHEIIQFKKICNIFFFFQSLLFDLKTKLERLEQLLLAADTEEEGNDEDQKHVEKDPIILVTAPSTESEEDDYRKHAVFPGSGGKLFQVWYNYKPIFRLSSSFDFFFWHFRLTIFQVQWKMFSPTLPIRERTELLGLKAKKSLALIPHWQQVFHFLPSKYLSVLLQWTWMVIELHSQIFFPSDSISSQHGSISIAFFRCAWTRASNVAIGTYP